MLILVIESEGGVEKAIGCSSPRLKTKGVQGVVSGRRADEVIQRLFWVSGTPSRCASKRG